MKRMGKIMWNNILEIAKYIVRRIRYKARLESKIDIIIQDNKDLKLEMLRLKFLQLVQHSPEEKTAICETYDAYKKNGGNSFVDSMFEKWLKSQNKKKKTKRK